MGLIDVPPPAVVEVIDTSRDRFKNLSATTFTVRGILEHVHIESYAFFYEPLQFSAISKHVCDRFEAVEESANTSFTTIGSGSGVTNSDSFVTSNYKSELTASLPLTRDRSPFDVNDAYVVSVANSLFEGTKPLTGVEAEVLDRTFRRVVKRTPTLPNRR